MVNTSSSFSEYPKKSNKVKKTDKQSYSPQVPKDRAYDRDSFHGNSKYADWSEKELWKMLDFLNNKPNPEDLEENPDGGYRA